MDWLSRVANSLFQIHNLALNEIVMPLFTVRRRVDAYVNYVAQIEADSAADAAEMASDDEAAFTWEEDGTDEFDARLFIALDDDGAELEDTEVRDF